MNTVGERIKYLRKDVLKKSQKEFGETLGLKANSISCIETEVNTPSDQTIKAICREFNINETWLITGNEEIYVGVEDETAVIVSELLEESNPTYDIIKGIMKTYQKLDSKSQQVIDDFAKLLLEELKKGD